MRYTYVEQTGNGRHLSLPFKTEMEKLSTIFLLHAFTATVVLLFSPHIFFPPPLIRHIFFSACLTQKHSFKSKEQKKKRKYIIRALMRVLLKAFIFYISNGFFFNSYAQQTPSQKYIKKNSSKYQKARENSPYRKRVKDISRSNLREGWKKKKSFSKWL